MVTDPDMRFKQALVTGASGIVGVPLCRALARAGVKVVTLTRTGTGEGLPEGLVHVVGNITNEKSVAAAAEGCDVIFHVAAAVHGSVSTYSEFKRLNVGGTSNVIQVAREIGAKLIHVSSVNVAGYRSGELADPYAETKSMAEDLVLEAAANGLDAVIVRPATVFGDEPSRAGLLVDRLLAGSLKILPAPSRKISPVWSGDLASAIVAAAMVGQSGDIHTVAGPSMKSGDFVETVCKAAGLKRPIVSIPAVIFAVPLQLAWWTKAITRWTPPVSVESLMNGSVHDGAAASKVLGFSYTPLDEIFGESPARR